MQLSPGSSGDGSRVFWSDPPSWLAGSRGKRDGRRSWEERSHAVSSVGTHPPVPTEMESWT